jgi:hypothetical protein
MTIVYSVVNLCETKTLSNFRTINHNCQKFISDINSGLCHFCSTKDKLHLMQR